MEDVTLCGAVIVTVRDTMQYVCSEININVLISSSITEMNVDILNIIFFAQLIHFKKERIDDSID